LIVGLYYLSSGVNGLLNVGKLSGYAAAKGVPAASAAVIVSHLLLILAAACILTGWKPAVGVVALVLFFLPVTFKIHAFWADKDPAMKANDMVHFLKNIGLMGSALMFLGIPLPWRWSRGPASAAPIAPRAAA